MLPIGIVYMNIEYMIASIYYAHDVSCIQRNIFLKKNKMSVVVNCDG